MTVKTLRAAALALLAPLALAAQTQVTAAGASFPYPIYQRWIDAFNKLHPNTQINYQPVGSGAGIRQVTDGLVSFGATDGPMNDTQIAEFKTKRGSDVLHLPTVIGAVVPIYNLPGDPSIKFTGEMLAGIFLGKITKWNDPAIAKSNAGVKLPNSDIIVAHRSDGSGTTFIFTDYLSKVSPEWQQKVGKGNSVNWPVGLGGAQNAGVAATVKQTEGAIGYVELIYAVQNKISYGAVQNAAGEFLVASLESASTAAAGVAASMPADFRVSITNAPGKGAYPISSFTWLLIPTKIGDAAKRTAIVDFVKWALADGQKMAEGLSYSRIPPAIIAKELQALAQVK